MASEMLVYDSIAQSNIPRREKSIVRAFIDSMLSESPRGRDHYREPRESRMTVAVQTVRQYGESGIVGGALGALHAELPNGLDVKKVAIDAALAFAGGVVGVAFADRDAGKDFTNIGAAGATVYSFRSTYSLLAEKRIANGGQPGGKLGGTRMSGEETDPIEAVAKKL